MGVLDKWKPDVTVVLAHRGPWMGLWATITSCQVALKKTDYEYDFVVVVNGEKKIARDMQNCLEKMAGYGKLRQLVVHPEPLSPPTARQLGAIFAEGKYLAFFDNHCLAPEDYFTRGIGQMEEKNIDLLHSAATFHIEGGPQFEYELTLDKNFWAKYGAPKPKFKNDPYRVAMAGHGGFIARNSVWKELGGYWTGFKGYGGEESYLNLKYWLLGKETWIDPKLIHYHFAGDRDYPRHATDDYYRNMMMCANIIGGEDWLYKVYETFERSSKEATGKIMYDLLVEAQTKSAAHAKEFGVMRQKTLQQQIEYFAANDIPH